MNNQHTQQEHKKDVKSSVLERLSKDHIEPRSKMFWRCAEYSVWILWGASVLIGALAVAVLIFVSIQASYALYEATHESTLTFVIDILPVLWLGLFFFMTVLAYYNLRHTKQGYKYSLLHIAGSSFLFSVVGGTVLHFAGVGYILDTQLSRFAPSYYLSQEDHEVSMWQAPDRGRLIGQSQHENATSSVISFTDVEGITWYIDTTDLYPPDLRILQKGNKVRVLGTQASTTAHTLHACGVFPWMFDKEISLLRMKEERRNFVERMYAHKDRAKERETALQEKVFGERAMGVCADMPTVRRIDESMN